MTTFVHDGSHYDGQYPVTGLLAAGVGATTHKATEGLHYVDSTFGQYAGQVAALDTLGGAYHVLHAGNAAAQARRFVDILDELAPWWRTVPFLIQLDCERWSDGYPRSGDIDEWVGQFAELDPHPVRAYCPEWLYGDTLTQVDVALWASDYGANPAYGYVQAYVIANGDTSGRWRRYSGHTPDLLQYGSRVTAGPLTTCDMSAYRGTLQDLIDSSWPKGTPMLTTADLAAIREQMDAALTANNPRLITAELGTTLGHSGPTVGVALQELAGDDAEIDAMAAAAGLTPPAPPATS